MYRYRRTAKSGQRFPQHDAARVQINEKVVVHSIGTVDNSVRNALLEIKEQQVRHPGNLQQIIANILKTAVKQSIDFRLTPSGSAAEGRSISTISG